LALVLSTIASALFTPVIAAEQLPSQRIGLPGRPFGVVVSSDQKWIFVSVTAPEGRKAGIVLLREDSGKIETVRFVPMGRTPNGLVLTHDGTMLIAAADDYVVFFDVQRLVSGAESPAFQWVFRAHKAGSICANVTADDRTLFVTDEWLKTITVIDLDRIRALGRDSAANLKRAEDRDGSRTAIIGHIPVGRSPVSMVFSSDQRWLYTTSEVADASWNWPRTLEPEQRKPGAQMEPEGAVVVIDVAKARSNPEGSIVSRVPSGGSPVRLALSPDGRTLYVSARGSNAVNAFDTNALVRDPAHARVATLRVGESPVPIVLVANGAYALVGNSKRFSSDAVKESTLTVVNTSRIGTAEEPVVGTVACGAFPRNFCLAPDGTTLFLTNYLSESLQVIDVSRIATAF
jgi:DNA-binding beta-propeller fold protein YncE